MSIAANNSHVSAAGTLVLVIPCSEGVVIAADGLTTLTAGRNKVAVPSDPKIRALSNTTAFFITGTGNYRKLSQNIDSLENAPKLWAAAADSFNSHDVAQSVLKPEEKLSLASIQLAGRHLADAMYDYVTKNIGRLAKDADVCNLVVVQYDPAAKKTTIGVAPLVTDQRGRVRAAIAICTEVAHEGTFMVRPYGENVYMDEHVWKAGSAGHATYMELRKHLPEKLNIEDASASLAATIGRCTIEAAEVASKAVPPPAFIGGEKLVYLINGTTSPVQI